MHIPVIFMLILAILMVAGLVVVDILSGKEDGGHDDSHKSQNSDKNRK